MIPCLIRRAISSWLSWRSRKTIHRAIPGILEADQREHEALARGNTRAIGRARSAKRRAMTAALSGGR